MKIPDSKPISAPPAATHSAPSQGGKDTAGPKTGQTGNPKAFSKLLAKNEEPETPLGGEVGKGGDVGKGGHGDDLMAGVPFGDVLSGKQKGELGDGMLSPLGGKFGGKVGTGKLGPGKLDTSKLGPNLAGTGKHDAFGKLGLDEGKFKSRRPLETEHRIEDLPTHVHAVGDKAIQVEKTEVVQSVTLPKEIESLVQEVQVGINAKGNDEVRIELNSKTFDGLKIQIERNAGQISINLQSQSDAVSKLLASNVGALTQALSDRGLNVGVIQVQKGAELSQTFEERREHKGEGGGQGRQQGQGQGGRQQGQR